MGKGEKVSIAGVLPFGRPRDNGSDDPGKVLGEEEPQLAQRFFLELLFRDDRSRNCPLTTRRMPSSANDSRRRDWGVVGTITLPQSSILLLSHQGLNWE